VGDAGGGAYHHRRIEPLAEVEGVRHKIVGFLAVAGLEHGYFGQPGIVAVVLLSLRAVGAGVVSADNDQAAIDTGG